LKIETSEFDLGAYNRFLVDEADSIAAFKSVQQASFDAERERWRAAGQAEYVGEPEAASATNGDDALAPHEKAVLADVSGSVWKVLVESGDEVAEGQTVAIVESMKMEIAVTAPASGVVARINCKSGAPVQAGQALMVIGAADALLEEET
jgi:urea carboxylase